MKRHVHFTAEAAFSLALAASDGGGDFIASTGEDPLNVAESRLREKIVRGLIARHEKAEELANNQTQVLHKLNVGEFIEEIVTFSAVRGGPIAVFHQGESTDGRAPREGVIISTSVYFTPSRKMRAWKN